MGTEVLWGEVLSHDEVGHLGGIGVAGSQEDVIGTAPDRVGADFLDVLIEDTLLFWTLAIFQESPQCRLFPLIGIEGAEGGGEACLDPTNARTLRINRGLLDLPL